MITIRRIVILLLCGFVLLLICIAVSSAIQSSSTLVVLTNLSDGPLRDVVLHVSGRDYRVGTLSGGQTISVSVDPQWDSHLEIGFTSRNGNRKRVHAGGYFGPGISARLVIELDEEGIVSQEFTYR